MAGLGQLLGRREPFGLSTGLHPERHRCGEGPEEPPGGHEAGVARAQPGLHGEWHLGGLGARGDEALGASERGGALAVAEPRAHPRALV